MREELRNAVDSILEKGVMRPSTSPDGSPFVIINQKDGSNSVCVDFKKLNKIYKEDPEPMQWLKTCSINSVASNISPSLI